MAIPLHNHSEFSAIDGVSKPSEIVARAVEMGCPCCGLTDHGVVTGHYEFAEECRKGGIKPIFGCELYHGDHFGTKKPTRDQAHLIALAMTDEGLKNLWRMQDAAAQPDRQYFVGRNTWVDYEKFKDGIVFTSACPASLVNKGIMRGDLEPLNRHLEVFGDNFYMELTTYPGDMYFNDKDVDEPILVEDYNKRIADIARERGIPLVYGDDGHYAFPDQWEFHDAYVARSTKQTIFTPIEERKMWHPKGAVCMKSEAEVREALSYLSDSVVDEAINSTHEIGERANATLPDVSRHLPVFIPDASPWVEKGKYGDDDADLLFLDLVEAGMTRCYGDEPSERVQEQTAFEAEVFVDSGLHHYFLMEWDMIEYINNPSAIFDDVDPRPIEKGPGRGSSAGCIVARELDITDIDPLPYDLYFERFWNPGRAKGFPDIDTDIEKRRRAEVKRYLSWRYGHDRVRSIGTVTRLMPKAVVDKMSGPCGLTFAERDDIKKIIDRVTDIEILGPDQIGWDRKYEPKKVNYVMEDVGEELHEYIDKAPKNRRKILLHFLDVCEALCNRVSNYGIHASGVVVSDVDLPEWAPSMGAGTKLKGYLPVTQWPMDLIDKLMFVKLDLLGLRTLDVLADWRQTMIDKYDIEINWSGLEWDEHEDEMWDLLENGYTAGIFQIEKGLAKRMAEDFKPRSVSDISIISALNRPGPIGSGAPESFIKRRAGMEEVEYDDPALEELLADTYGWFLYQESVIAYFRKLGYSESDADAVRKILGKKQPEKWAALHDGLEEWEGKSYVQSTAKAGISPENAEKIWLKLVDFGKYSFNKSHTVAYSTISFRELFAKFYEPAEFYASCIRNVDKQKRAEYMPAYINEARRWGIEVHGPDIINSKADVSVSDGNIYFGFGDVKGFGDDSTSADFLVSLRDEGAPMDTPEALFDYLEGLGKERAKANRELVKAGKPKLTGKSAKQKLGSNKVEALYTAGAWERLEGYPTPLRELQQRENETLMVILSDNTAEAFANAADEVAQCDTYEEAKTPYDVDRRYTLPGVITSIVDRKVRNGKNTGKPMGIVTIEFEGDSLEFAVFHEKWVAYKFLWHERTPAIFEINHQMNTKTGSTGYNMEKATKL